MVSATASWRAGSLFVTLAVLVSLLPKKDGSLRPAPYTQAAANGNIDLTISTASAPSPGEERPSENPPMTTTPLEAGSIRPIRIEDEMRASFVDYAMSVNISRAIPDVRDGLKPVQRRILYSMSEMNLQAGSGYRKSATVVGEVMGKYHPHGDIPIYDSLVRMAQNWALRYPLVDGQGNFGSVDNDP